jgi:predicted DCC family thiol-disulfide oxidoreductase YuxK
MAAIITNERPHPRTAHGKKAVVIYDGECPLCRRSVRLLRGLDWFNVLAYADARHPAQLPELPVPVEPSRFLEEMHLLTPNGQAVHHGFRAFRWLAWRLPLLWVVAPLLYLPGAETLGQRLYLWVARNRFRLLPCHGGVCTLPRK